MRALALAILASLLAVAPLAASNASARADAHLRDAQTLLRRGRAKDARLELQAALTLAPGRPDLVELLQSLDSGAPKALSSAAAGPEPEAALLIEGLEARLERPLARARASYKDNDLRAAATAYREALQLVPGNAEARAGLQRIEDEAYRHDADQPFDRAVADLYEEGMREMRKGRLVEARRKFDEAKALNPAQPQLLRALGAVAEGAQRQQGSRDAASLVLEGQRHAAAQDDAKAAAAFSAALEASPGLQAAQAGLDQVRRRNRQRVAGAIKQGEQALQSRAWDAAQRHFELALSLDPAEPQARQGLALARARQQSLRSAAAQRREADAHYNAGVDAWQAGDLAQAAVRFRDALAVLPEDAEAAKALAAVRKKLEERADKDRQDAVRLLDEGRTLEGRGALDEALRRYERALAKDPGLAPAADARQGLQQRLAQP
jgi:tetratricopeptide (TPR) repeat protein